MGRTGTKAGTKGRNWPEAERGTRKVGWRLTPETLAAVKARAAELHETEGDTVEAMLAVALARPEEVAAEIVRRREKTE